MARTETGIIETSIGGQDFRASYEKFIWESFDELVAEAAKGPTEAAVLLKKFNNAEDSERKLAARQRLLNDGDAAKAQAIESQVKAMQKSREKHHLPQISDEEARKKVIRMMDEE